MEVTPRTIARMTPGRAPCLVELSGLHLTPEVWQRTLLVGGTKPASAYIATAERWLREGSVIYLSGIGHGTRPAPVTPPHARSGRHSRADSRDTAPL